MLLFHKKVVDNRNTWFARVVVVVLCRRSRFKEHVIDVALVRTFHFVVVKLVVGAVGADGKDAGPVGHVR